MWVVFDLVAAAASWGGEGCDESGDSRGGEGWSVLIAKGWRESAGRRAAGGGRDSINTRGGAGESG